MLCTEAEGIHTQWNFSLRKATLDSTTSDWATTRFFWFVSSKRIAEMPFWPNLTQFQDLGGVQNPQKGPFLRVWDSLGSRNLGIKKWTKVGFPEEKSALFRLPYRTRRSEVGFRHSRAPKLTNFTFFLQKIIFSPEKQFWCALCPSNVVLMNYHHDSLGSGPIPTSSANFNAFFSVFFFVFMHFFLLCLRLGFLGSFEPRYSAGLRLVDLRRSLMPSSFGNPGS